ncbi:unnamed protein product [Amoebophrya sp. A120]|nr:unnamed protein product [Amoebophrya sp. A120]|eukprot:GSA120T00020904001.1
MQHPQSTPPRTTGSSTGRRGAHAQRSESSCASSTTAASGGAQLPNGAKTCMIPRRQQQGRAASSSGSTAMLNQSSISKFKMTSATPTSTSSHVAAVGASNSSRIILPPENASILSHDLDDHAAGPRSASMRGVESSTTPAPSSSEGAPNIRLQAGRKKVNDTRLLHRAEVLGVAQAGESISPATRPPADHSSGASSCSINNISADVDMPQYVTSMFCDANSAPKAAAVAASARRTTAGMAPPGGATTTSSESAAGKRNKSGPGATTPNLHQGSSCTSSTLSSPRGAAHLANARKTNPSHFPTVQPLRGIKLGSPIEVPNKYEMETCRKIYGERAVFLHVYDLDPVTARLNRLSMSVANAGLFHVGVEVFREEWFYCKVCGNHPLQTGIVHTVPMEGGGHVYRQSFYMGESPFSAKEFWRLLTKVRSRWLASDYELWSKNCQHFAIEICRELDLAPVPDFITNLPRCITKDYLSAVDEEHDVDKESSSSCSSVTYPPTSSCSEKFSCVGATGTTASAAQAGGILEDNYEMLTTATTCGKNTNAIGRGYPAPAERAVLSSSGNQQQSLMQPGQQQQLYQTSKRSSCTSTTTSATCSAGAALVGGITTTTPPLGSGVIISGAGPTTTAASTTSSCTLDVNTAASSSSCTRAAALQHTPATTSSTATAVEREREDFAELDAELDAAGPLLCCNGSDSDHSSVEDCSLERFPRVSREDVLSTSNGCHMSPVRKPTTSGSATSTIAAAPMSHELHQEQRLHEEKQFSRRVEDQDSSTAHDPMEVELQMEPNSATSVLVPVPMKIPTAAAAEHVVTGQAQRTGQRGDGMCKNVEIVHDELQPSQDVVTRTAATTNQNAELSTGHDSILLSSRPEQQNVLRQQNVSSATVDPQKLIVQQPAPVVEPERSDVPAQVMWMGTTTGATGEDDCPYVSSTPVNNSSTAPDSFAAGSTCTTRTKNTSMFDDTATSTTGARTTTGAAGVAQHAAVNKQDLLYRDFVVDQSLHLRKHHQNYTASHLLHADDNSTTADGSKDALSDDETSAMTLDMDQSSPRTRASFYRGARSAQMARGVGGASSTSSRTSSSRGNSVMFHRADHTTDHRAVFAPSRSIFAPNGAAAFAPANFDKTNSTMSSSTQQALLLSKRRQQQGKKNYVDKRKFASRIESTVRDSQFAEDLDSSSLDMRRQEQVINDFILEKTTSGDEEENVLYAAEDLMDCERQELLGGARQTALVVPGSTTMMTNSATTGAAGGTNDRTSPVGTRTISSAAPAQSSPGSSAQRPADAAFDQPTGRLCRAATTGANSNHASAGGEGVRLLSSVEDRLRGGLQSRDAANLDHIRANLCTPRVLAAMAKRDEVREHLYTQQQMKNLVAASSSSCTTSSSKAENSTLHNTSEDLLFSSAASNVHHAEAMDDDLFDEDKSFKTADNRSSTPPSCVGSSGGNMSTRKLLFSSATSLKSNSASKPPGGRATTFSCGTTTASTASGRASSSSCSTASEVRSVDNDSTSGGVLRHQHTMPHNLFGGSSREHHDHMTVLAQHQHHRTSNLFNNSGAFGSGTCGATTSGSSSFIHDEQFDSGVQYSKSWSSGTKTQQLRNAGGDYALHPVSETSSEGGGGGMGCSLRRTISSTVSEARRSGSGHWQQADLWSGAGAGAGPQAGGRTKKPDSCTSTVFGNTEQDLQPSSACSYTTMKTGLKSSEDHCYPEVEWETSLVRSSVHSGGSCSSGETFLFGEECGTDHLPRSTSAGQATYGTRDAQEVDHQLPHETFLWEKPDPSIALSR